MKNLILAFFLIFFSNLSTFTPIELIIKKKALFHSHNINILNKAIYYKIKITLAKSQVLDQKKNFFLSGGDQKTRGGGDKLT